MKVVLTIAGSDSGGGAGVQADLLTFAAHRLHGTCAVTALTAQSSVAVLAWQPVEPGLVTAQLEAVANDMPVAASKTGMLGSRAVIEAVAGACGRLALGPLVVDPVMVAKSGDALLDPAAERAYVELLFPLAAVVTPNLLEAGRLLGRKVEDVPAMREAARALLALGPGAVLVKGGARLGGDEAVDVYCDRERLVELRGPRVVTPHTHGTGCALSAALCARLALGDEVLTAVRAARAYLLEGLRRAHATGHGRGTIDHLHPLAPPLA